MKSMRMMFAIAGVLAVASPAISQPAAPQTTHCFFASQFENWRAPDNKTIYIRVGMHRYYRLDMAGSCPSLTQPGAFLVTKLWGGNTYCTALDWDLHVSTSWHDIPTACIVKKMTELTPDEAAALPKSAKP